MTSPVAYHQAEDEPTKPAAQVEAEAEQNARDDGAVQVALGDDGPLLWVPDQRQWRSSALSALNTGNFQAWADRTLAEEDAEAWEDHDPTVDEVEAFFEAHAKLSGADVGKRRRSARGARPMRRR